MADYAAEWEWFHQAAQERYPDLPFHEAQVNFLHDSFVKLPKECAKELMPILPDLVKEVPEVVETAGIYCGSPQVALLSRLAAVITNFLSGKAARSVAAADMGHVVNEVHNIHVIGKSPVDHVNYYGRWMRMASTIQIAQENQKIKLLTDISKHLDESNTITVSGSGGPDGFAQHVYDFIEEAIDRIDEKQRDYHRIFVYNPDTDWYGAFRRLIRQNPLPPTFCAKSDNLDTLCQYMQGVRAQVKGESKRGDRVIFHLLLPSWYRISIQEPLHFPDDLQPLQVEGRKHKGKPLVEFNLPAAPAGLLHGVANVLDPRSANAVAQGVSAVVTLPAIGWGVNGACLALGCGIGTITGLGAFAVIPIWLGTAMPAMGKAGPIMLEGIYDALCEEAPRILGSNQRLDLTL